MKHAVVPPIELSPGIATLTYANQVVSGGEFGSVIGYRAVANIALQAARAGAEFAEYEQHEKEYWKDQALIDPLTGVGSRRAFELYMEEHGEPIAVLFIDGDNVGETNKKHGQDAGDHTIKSLAEIIKGSTRKNDRIFRVGGDEFVVILGEPEVNEEDAADLTTEQASMMRHPSYVERKLDQTATADTAELVRGFAEVMLLRIHDNGLFAGIKDLEVGLSVGAAIREEGMTTQQLFDNANIDMRVRKLAKLPEATPRMLEIHKKYLEDMAEEGLSPHIITKMAKAGLFDLAV